MQNFLNFVKKVHEKADCKIDSCDVKFFLEQMEDIFNEELSYDAWPIKFTEVCLANISVFSAMFQIHDKHKDCLDNIFDEIEDPLTIVNRQLERNEQLTKLILEKYTIQKKIDALVENVFLVKWFFTC